jgi:hypothetical protein
MSTEKAISKQQQICMCKLRNTKMLLKYLETVEILIVSWTSARVLKRKHTQKKLNSVQNSSDKRAITHLPNRLT